jgi:hypothetical protein
MSTPKNEHDIKNHYMSVNSNPTTFTNYEKTSFLKNSKINSLCKHMFAYVLIVPAADLPQMWHFADLRPEASRSLQIHISSLQK